MNKIKFEDLKKVNIKLNINFNKLFINFLNSGNYILGDGLRKFEKSFAVYNAATFSLGCGSGYDAIVLALKSLHLPKNSEIILPSNAYIAAYFAIINSGYVPIPVEPNINTYNLDPNKIEEKINKKTKCIMPVHMYGLISDMVKIKKIAKKYNIKIIEDCAQAFGSKYKNKYAGSFSDVAAFSFYPTKNLGALGDGGAIITNSKKYYNDINYLRNYGFKTKNYAEKIGINSRLDEIQAIILNEKLKKIDKFIKYKRRLAEIYNNELNDRFIKPLKKNDYYHTFHIYNIRIDKRDMLINYLKNKNIQTSVHYPLSPIKQKPLKKYFKADYPISKLIHNTTISLPLSYSHTEKEIKKIAKIINSF